MQTKSNTGNLTRKHAGLPWNFAQLLWSSRNCPFDDPLISWCCLNTGGRRLSSTVCRARAATFDYTPSNFPIKSLFRHIFFTMLPPMFTNFLHHFPSMHFTFASLSSNDLTLQTFSTPSNHLVQGLPIPLLPLKSYSSCLVIHPSLRQHQKLAFKFKHSYFFHINSM